MPPWVFSCNYLFSGETSPGNYVLMAAKSTKALQMNTAKFNDNGSTYQPIIKTQLFSVVPDFGKRFSYVAGGLYDEPTRTGVPWIFEVDTNNTSLADVLVVIDDDPTTATYTSIAANKQDASVVYNRAATGVNIVQNVYPIIVPLPTTPNAPVMARWAGFQFKLANADQLDKVYGWLIAYKSER